MISILNSFSVKNPPHFLAKHIFRFIDFMLSFNHFFLFNISIKTEERFFSFIKARRKTMYIKRSSHVLLGIFLKSIFIPGSNRRLI